MPSKQWQKRKYKKNYYGDRTDAGAQSHPGSTANSVPGSASLVEVAPVELNQRNESARASTSQINNPGEIFCRNRF